MQIGMSNSCSSKKLAAVTVDLVRGTSRRLSADLRDMGRDLSREFRDMGREIRDIHREIGQRIRSSSLHNIPRIEISRLGIASFHDRDSDSDELIHHAGNYLHLLELTWFVLA